jgi:hypothetical protein
MVALARRIGVILTGCGWITPRSGQTWSCLMRPDDPGSQPLPV